MLSSHILSGEDSAGKRDDDRKPTHGGSLLPPWFFRSGLTRLRRRRMLVLIVAVLALYLFIENMPPNTRNSQGSLLQSYHSFHDLGSAPLPVSPQHRPNTLPQESNSQTIDVAKHYYDGPIKFYKLASSLHKIAGTMGHRAINRNVLFAAASLKSASLLLPMACEMARWRRNKVHFAFIGRDEIPLEMLLEMNSIESECEVFWHDGRPDYAEMSSDLRMEVSVSAALSHVNTFMHPQAVIIDGSENEDLYFKKGVRKRSNLLSITVIELPINAGENLLWITRLDSGSLKAWNAMTLDIVVQPPPGSSGSLIRLLRSLQHADYFGSPPPRLSIDLPAKVDWTTLHFLDHFEWPPERKDCMEPHVKQLTVRRRIPRQHISSEESSVRFLESFYPLSPERSHVLVLSAQTELSPLYYHYLKYTLLEYKFSTYGSEDHNGLLGISLDLPSVLLDDKTRFSLPKVKYDPLPEEDLQGLDAVTPFLWQSPNSNAALYFGDKWIELHDFISNQLQILPKHNSEKRVSKAFPAWMEYALDLAQARGYTMLYPGFTSDGSMATVHTDLYKPAEEFSTDVTDSNDPQVSDDLDAPFTANPATYRASLHQPEVPLITQNLISVLPFEGDLPEMDNMPILLPNGKMVNESLLQTSSAAFANDFRRNFGGCAETAQVKRRKKLSTGDLFCFKDEEMAEE